MLLLILLLYTILLLLILLIAAIPSYPEVTLIKSHATDVWLAINPPIQDGGMPITGYIIQNQGTTQEFGLGMKWFLYFSLNVALINLMPYFYVPLKIMK